MNSNQGQRTSLLALGTAGAVGAAAMYGISRINRNGGFQQLAQNAQNSKPMENIQSSLPVLQNNNSSEQQHYDLFPNTEY